MKRRYGVWREAEERCQRVSRHHAPPCRTRSATRRQEGKELTKAETEHLNRVCGAHGTPAPLPPTPVRMHILLSHHAPVLGACPKHDNAFRLPSGGVRVRVRLSAFLAFFFGWGEG